MLYSSCYIGENMENNMKSIVWIVTLIMLILNISKIIDIPWIIVFAPVLIWYSIWIISIIFAILFLSYYGIKKLSKRKK